MFKRFTNIFRPVMTHDPILGDLKLQENTDEGTYYLEANLWVDFLSHNIYFTIETRTKRPTAFQCDRFAFIKNNLEELWRLALEKLEKEYGDMSKGLKSKYQLESFYIPVDTEASDAFELIFLNKVDNFSTCIVVFDNGEPNNISFES